jgi:hypothetical protein
VQGQYNIYSDGLLIHQTNNLITTQGKNRIRQILAGKTNGFASSILVGVGATTPTADDTVLDFAVEGATILNTMVDDVTNKIFFKTSLPVDKQYKIYELGCYAADGVTAKQYQQNSLLISFGELTTWTDTSGTHSLNSTNTRVGAFSIRYSLLAAGVGRGSTPFQIGLDQLPTYTQFKLAYFANNIASIKVRFKTTDSDYYEGSITPATNNAYNISSVNKSSFVATGVPSWSTITNIEVQATATGSAGTIDLDSIRYDVATTADSLLLSRALPASPVIKPAGSTMDIEYLLEGIV